MDLLKKELNDQHQKTIKSLHLKNILINLPGVLAFSAFILYVKSEDDAIGMLIATCLFSLYTSIIGIPHLIKVRKLRKAHEQQMAELDAEE